MRHTGTARHLHRRDLLIAGGSLIGSVAARPLLAQGVLAPIGKVADLRGDASAERAGTPPLPLGRQADIFVGDLLSTSRDARLTLRLGPATTIRLGGDTRLKIERYLAEVGGELDLQAGHLMFQRTGKPASDGITFRSAYGLMAVRGTRFFAGPNRGQFAVLVGEGIVEVSAGGRTVLVRPQQGIDIKAPGQPPTTPATWKLPRIREMQQSFR
jgi:hypothetical protein